MHIEFSSTFEDYKTAQIAHLRNKRKRWVQKLLLSIFGAIGVACACAGLFAGPKLDWTAPIIWLTLFVILWPTFFFLGRWQFRRGWKGQPSLELHQRWDISDAGIKTDNGTTSSEMKWTAFRSFLDQPTLFMLYPSEFSFHMVPKRAFADDAQVEEFRDLLHGHIQPQTQAFPVIPSAKAEQAP
jgi:hypothetical protein